MSEPLFTVFTATFNRASCINRVYDSLQAQTLKDFEWIVVDDGSTDDTESVVKGFEKAADFPVRYFRKAHEGKPAAWNMVFRRQGENCLSPLIRMTRFCPMRWKAFDQCGRPFR